MRYSRRLLLSMAIPTIMVGGAGSSVVAGAWWLASVAPGIDSATLVAHLNLAQLVISVLTALCVGCCC